MTEEQLQAIKERVVNSTQGPWRLDLWDGLLISEVTKGVILKAGQGRMIKAASEDIKFIAHAREDVPALIAELELQKANAEQYLQDNVELHNENLILKNEIQRLSLALDHTELAEVKARIEIEAGEVYLTALLKKRILQINDLQTDNERLRGALDEISDLENFYGHDKSYYQNLLSKAIVISCKALEGAYK